MERTQLFDLMGELKLFGMKAAFDALRFMLAFDSRGHDLVEGGLHAVELELTHEVEELSSFHQMVLLRLS